MAIRAALDSDTMALINTQHKNSSIDCVCAESENSHLKAQIAALKLKTRQLEGANLIREAESACDFAYGQMDRVVSNVRNFNYGIDKLESAVDSIRRYDALRSKRDGLVIEPCREAVSVVFLSMDHYVHKQNVVSQTAALFELTELAGRISKYFDMRSRPADCFSKGGWQDYMFMFVLPATDRRGAGVFLDRVVKTAINGYGSPLSISYGIANYAADVRELHAYEQSRLVASRLLDAAKNIAKNNCSEFSGRIRHN